MTLDEAIQRENKIAEENQKIVDTQIVFDDVSISELYCDDTEVIEEHLSNYRKCAEYHKQITDWLEELKDYRDKNKMVVRIDCANSDEFKDMAVKLAKEQYNKAVDDFVKLAKEHNWNIRNRNENEFIYGAIDRLAEQLKEGGENESNN